MKQRQPCIFLLVSLCAAVGTAVFLSPLSTTAQTPPPDWRFGVIESYEDPAAATELGVAWTRVLFPWNEIQPDGPEQWANPRVTDAQIEAEIAAGREVTALLLSMPAWARDEKDLPQGLWLEPDDPANLWANFVREAVGRYQGRIRHWIIWNEPDIDGGAVAHTWHGTVDDFYQLQRIAYLVAKETDPNVVVHLSAFTYWADANIGREQYMARLLDRILQDPEAAEHNYYFDVATAHLYFQSTQVYSLIRFFKGLMAERGLDQPIWLAESNVPPVDDPAWPVETPLFTATVAEQAAFMPQMLSAALTGGAERVAVFKLRDNETDRQANPEPFGLIRQDGTQRPAFATYQVAMQQLSGVISAYRFRWDGVAAYRLNQGDRETTVLFSRLPEAQEVTIPVTETAVLLDMWGQELPLRVSLRGNAVIELPGAACTQLIGGLCMIGGPVVYLVQPTGGEPATATVTPTPSPTPLETATSPATATLPPTATPSATPTPTAAATATPAATATLPPPPATATATVPPTAPVVAAATPMPNTTPAAGASLGLILLGAAGTLALGLSGWVLFNRRNR